MVDFVLEQGGNPLQSDTQCWIKTHNYTEFLNRPLSIEMFVPCDENGNVLKEPYILDQPHYSTRIEYNKAKERCLFEGFEAKKAGLHYVIELNDISIWISWNESKTIEDLIQHKPKLTATALKQIGL